MAVCRHLLSVSVVARFAAFSEAQADAFHDAVSERTRREQRVGGGGVVHNNPWQGRLAGVWQARC